MVMMAKYEEFQHKGKTWKQCRAPEPDECYVLGVDLGQSQDPTALAVLHHTLTPTEEWDVNERLRTTRPVVEERFDVVHAERLPLGTLYPAVIEHVIDVLSRKPLRERCHFCLDESGVGRAVADQFDDAGLNPVRVCITAGSDAQKMDGHPRRFSVPKTILISAVDARVHTGELRVAAELSEASAIAEELKEFRRNVTAAGRATYQARTGKHDDLVLAIAIALWWVPERNKYRHTTGTIRGLY